MKPSKHSSIEEIPEPTRIAKSIGLVYVSDAWPGITRKKSGKGYSYADVDGKTIRVAAELQRFRALVIPPAWTNVWICVHENGHIQATGRDARGRKQYRYHEIWRALRDKTKFHRMLAFGEALPRIREQTDAALSLRGLPKEKVIAAVLQLLDKTHIRVGDEEYARTNQSFGLTTMRDEHVEIAGTRLHFEFRGKSAQMHALDLKDPRLAKIVKRCQELPGEELFQYLDEAGQQQKIGSGDVNDMLRAITGQEFTAKDFRTWAGTAEAILALREIGGFTSETAAKKNITQAIKATAARLGNKPATCRKYYVHPAILEAYAEGTLLDTVEKHFKALPSSSPHELRPEENAVMELLKIHAEQEAAQEKKPRRSRSKAHLRQVVG